MTRLKFPYKSENRARAVLDLIHSDVCGPMQTVTPSGKRYVLTFIDDYSRYTKIYLLRCKSEVTEKFKEFVQMCNTFFGRKVKCIRSDRGGEYIAGEFMRYMAKEGIQYQRTASFSPEQNGVAERKNRCLIEMGRCMLLDAGMENTYWGEAVSMANFVQNRLPAKPIPNTPFECWFDRKPSVGYFRKFGSECYVHVPDEKRRKLDPKALRAILVGYDDASKAYRCFIPSTRKVVVSRDVRFIVPGEEWRPDLERSDYFAVSSEADECVDDGAGDLISDDEDGANGDESQYFSGEDNQPEAAIDVPVSQRPLRRSERSNLGVPPRRLIEELNVIKAVILEPKTYKEAISCDKKEKWIAAMKEEMSSLEINRTWDLVNLPVGRKPIGCRWVYKVKTDESGNIQRYKARLVAQGFSQKYGADYDQVFAPVIKHTTFRILLTIAAKEGMTVLHFDAKTAFLNGELRETIYMRQAPGFAVEDKQDQVCILRRSLYGLKQSARVWNEKLHGVLIAAGFVQSGNDPCLYIRTRIAKVVYILIYVDDLLLASKCLESLQECESTLKSNFEIKNLGAVKNYLGLKIDGDSAGGYFLSQRSYIVKLCEDFGLSQAKISDFPISVGYGKGEKTDELLNNENYRRLIGSLLYISVNTRPDVSASVSILAQKVSGPNQEDWNELKRVVRYLKGTMDKKLSLGNPSVVNPLIGYADANWGEDRIDRKSNSGYVFKLYGGVISWKCKRQTCVSLSSVEAEFVALSEACKEAFWIRRVLEEFNLNCEGPTLIYEDNQSCLKLVRDEKLSDLTKHIDLRVHFVKDYVDKGLVMCKYCPSEEMLADLLTKPLPGPRIRLLREKCGLVD